MAGHALCGRRKARGEGSSSPDQPGSPRSSASNCRAARPSCLVCSQEQSPGSWVRGTSPPPNCSVRRGSPSYFTEGETQVQRDVPSIWGCGGHLSPRRSPVSGGCGTCKVKGHPAPAHRNATRAGPHPGCPGPPTEMEQPRFADGVAGSRHPPGLRLSRRVRFTSAAFSPVPFPWGFLL